jgi:hypothetical protein
LTPNEYLEQLLQFASSWRWFHVHKDFCKRSVIGSRLNKEAHHPGNDQGECATVSFMKSPHHFFQFQKSLWTRVNSGMEHQILAILY